MMFFIEWWTRRVHLNQKCSLDIKALSPPSVSGEFFIEPFQMIYSTFKFVPFMYTFHLISWYWNYVYLLNKKDIFFSFVLSWCEIVRTNSFCCPARKMGRSDCGLCWRGRMLWHIKATCFRSGLYSSLQSDTTSSLADTTGRPGYGQPILTNLFAYLLVREWIGNV